MIVWVPIDRGLDNFPYYEAHGLAILALANRELAWPLGRIENALVVACRSPLRLLLVVGTPLRAGPRASPGRSPPRPACSSGTSPPRSTPRSASTTSAHSSRENIPKPNDWIDAPREAAASSLLGQQMNDDRSACLDRVLEPLDRQGVERRRDRPGPGHTLTPDLEDVDGTLWPRPGDRLRPRGERRRGRRPQVARERRLGATSYRLDGPIRLRSNETGIAEDGWTRGDPGDPTVPARAAYNRFDVSEGGTGTAVVTLSRETFCPKGVRLPGVARVRIGELGRGPDKQPAIARETGVGHALRPCLRRPDGGAADAGRPVARRGRDRRRSSRRRSIPTRGRRAPRARRARLVRRRRRR